MAQPTEPYTVSREEGKAVWFLGTLMTVKATAESTGQAFGLLEQVLPPGFSPPLHVHHTEDEAFYVLEGEIVFVCGDRTLRAGPGSFVFLPKDVVHGFRVEGTQPARTLQLTSPPGLEHFFEEAGEAATQLTLPPPTPPDIQTLLALADKYNVEITGPPLGH